jgi:splicing factor 45
VGQGGSDAAPPRALPPDAGAPSRVIVLRNLVGPGQVDESLEEEIGRSAERHGEVESVLIFEVTQPGFPAEEAVRVFVEFETAAAAAAALRDMHGRFFGGRVVAGRFFDEGRFAAGELAPLAGGVAPP